MNYNNLITMNKKAENNSSRTYNQNNNVIEKELPKENNYFYNKMKQKPVEVLERYISITTPKNQFESFFQPPYLADRNKTAKSIVFTKYIARQSEIKQELGTVNFEVYSSLADYVQDGLVNIEERLHETLKDEPANVLKDKFNEIRYRAVSEDTIPGYLCNLARLSAIKKIFLEREYDSIKNKIDKME